VYSVEVICIDKKFFLYITHTMTTQACGRMAFRFSCLACYGVSNASSRHMQPLRSTVRRMSEYYRIQDDVYGLTDDQKQVTNVFTVLGSHRCGIFHSDLSIFME